MKLIIDIPGGFGNQLFGYAFGYSLSRELGEKCEYCIHTPYQDSGITWDLQIDKLNILFDRRITYNWGRNLLDRVLLNRIRKILKVGLCVKTIHEDTNLDIDDYKTLISNEKKVIIYGNWENEKFFKRYRKELIEFFTPKAERDITVEKILQEVNDNPKSVGMHVRRGDKAEMGISLSAEYYNNLISKMIEYVDTPLIYVISDDIEWCKNNLKSKNVRLVYPEYNSDNKVIDDWLILKECNNHIVANSTFSWWAAWLCQNAKQIVICPKEMEYRLDKWISV